MHGTEAVAHVEVREGGELVGEGTTLGVVLTGLARVEAKVLQHGHLAVGQARGHRAGGLADRVGGERHGLTEDFTQPLGRGGQRVGRVRGALGAAQVGGDDHLGAALDELGDRRGDGADPAVVGDAGAVQRHVQVGADEDPLTGYLEVVDRLHEE